MRPRKARPGFRFPWPVWVAVGVAAVLVLGVGFLGVAKATDTPAFCGGACHEMSPFHTAWAEGAHKNIACVECHVDAGQTARLEHKFVALQEVVDHVKGAPQFPLATPPSVPDSRCLRCHANVVVNQIGFSHAQHAKRGPCIMCHATVGHQVTQVALRKAGVLRVSYSSVSATETTPTAKVDGGQANLAGHVAVACSRCHDMAATPCSACHKAGNGTDAKHPVRTDCTTCHTTGAKFVFTHPTSTDCGSCHKPTIANHPTNTDCTTCHTGVPGTTWTFTHPASTACATCHRPTSAKHPSNTDCTTCHKSPGKSWAFSHPGASANCGSCHTPTSSTHPNRTDCTTCHQNPGRSWTFSHPGQGATCSSCHARPANHNSGTCSDCHHNPGQNWKFSHPGAGANCASCHNRPSGHNPATCTMCHRNPGRNWAFSHPKVSSGCVSCHASKEPSNHYGTSCGSCHSPSRAWANAVFHHPSIPGGQHTYTSFACVKCHPSTGHGPGHYCSCHGNTTGPSGG